MNTIFHILEKFPSIKTVNIFGSRAKGNYKPGSDIDLAILNKGVDDAVIRNVSSDFEESSLPYKVDLINFPTLKHEELIEHINRVGITFYKAKVI